MKLKTLFTSVLAMGFLSTTQAQAGFFGDLFKEDPVLTQKDVSKAASAFAVPFVDAKVITDNDAAFDAKLAVIQSATKTLDLAYYIFASDYSSAKLVKAIFEQGKKYPDLKVRILLDFHDNYKRLDYLMMIRSQFKKAVSDLGGSGSLEVAFYNRPTPEIIKDAAFLTMPCSKGKSGKVCGQDKVSQVTSLLSADIKKGYSSQQVPGTRSGLFLSGLYSKTFSVVAKAVAEGQNLDLSKFKGEGDGEAVSDKDKEDLKELAKLIYQSKVGNPVKRILAKIQLGIAVKLYGKKVESILNIFSENLPVNVPRTEQSNKDWSYITDYLHHKLVMADGKSWVSGGRNVEDSYHTVPNELSAKYTFRDTDIYVQLDSPSSDMLKSYDRLFGFKQMVATMDEVLEMAPNGVVANVARAERLCEKEIPNAEKRKEDKAVKETFENCVGEKSVNEYALVDQRLIEELELFKGRLQVFETEYLNNSAVEKGTSGKVYQIDSGARLSYLENLPFNKNLPASKAQRNYGATVGKELESGKAIHEVWKRSLLRSCQTKSDVVLHNAYFLPPGPLTLALGKMVMAGRENISHGDQLEVRNCSGTNVSVITNSFVTTDLNVINFLARPYLREFIRFFDSNAGSKSPTLRYLEYQPGADSKYSLHSKVSVFGNSAIVGSANMDVRSFMMDTNNAMFIEDAPQFVSEYKNDLELLERKGTIANQLHTYLKEEKSFEQEDQYIIDQMLSVRFLRFLSADQKAALKVRATGLLNWIRKEVDRSLDRYILELDWTVGDKDEREHSSNGQRYRYQRLRDFDHRWKEM